MITELWFDDEDVFKGTVKYLSSTVMSDGFTADQFKLCDRSKNRMATTKVECDTEFGQA